VIPAPAVHLSLSKAPPLGHHHHVERRVRGACQLDCPDTCSWIVSVRDGEAHALRGDPDHPFTRGSLCNKVAGYLDYAKSPDRVLHPLRRRGGKGEARFERVSWDDALAEIATRFRAIIDTWGAEAIWPYVGCGSMGLIQGAYGGGARFWNVLGASRHDQNICTVAGGTGTEYTLGARVGMDPDTFRMSKLIVVWGANVLSTHPHMWRPMLEARRHGAHVVVIDPIATRTAAAADEHIAPVPGTDALLALGLLHVVLDEGAEDREFLATRTIGWDALRARIREHPPAQVAAACGVSVGAIVALGKRLAHTRPAGIRIGIGLQRHAGGGMAARTISCIPAVTGDWRHPGGGVIYDTRGFFKLAWPALTRDDLRTRDARTLYMSRLGDGLLSLDAPPVKALFVQAANPVASMPRQTEVRRGLLRDDLFTIVVDHFITDTARCADLVLPATMQLEHADLLIAYGHLYLAWNAPAVAPPGECVSTTELFHRLARAMGLTEPSLYDDERAIARQVLASDHPALAGITLDELERRGWMRLAYPEPFAPFATDAFPTPSGKVELVSERMASAGLDAVAGYTPPADAGYPLALLTPAAHNFLNSIFANVPDQLRRSGPPVVLVHPVDAEVRGIAHGASVRVFNARGAFVATAAVSDQVRVGVVASTKGRWGDANVNATVDDRDADMGHGAVYHDNRVELALA
jgi:anaerobic selenocysteine-containing dehydrogenase